MIERIRRIVTGEPRDRESLFTHVEEVGRTDAGMWFGVWGWDRPPELPIHSLEPYVARSILPALDGVRVNVVVHPAPGTGLTGDDARRAVEERERALDAVPGGRTLSDDPAHPAGMHRTDTIDIGVCVQGAISVTSTDGSEQILRPGDVYVQNGAMHAWKNASDGASVIVFVVLGAQRRE